MCRTMEAINKALSKFKLTMGPDADIEFDEAANILRFPRRLKGVGDVPAPGTTRLSDGRFVGAVVAPNRLAMHRVFNRTFDLGGRMYGGWWQSVPSSARRDLLIDGCPVAEVDYHHLHPRLLYAYAGHRLDGDAYTIKGCETERSLVKKALNTMVNASSWPEAKGAIASALGGDVAGAQRLMDAVARHHAPIRRLFCSGLGIRLQRIDSDVAIAVVTEMTIKHHIACYPVHDSFIVPRTERETLVAVMERCLEKGLATAASDGRSFRFGSKTSKKNNLHMKEALVEEVGLTRYGADLPAGRGDPDDGLGFVVTANLGRRPGPSSPSSTLASDEGLITSKLETIEGSTPQGSVSATLLPVDVLGGQLDPVDDNGYWFSIEADIACRC